MVQSAYVHIPFCKSKCRYCSFVSYPNCDERIREDYVDVLVREINHYYKNEPLKTLYLGGGTPSLLKTENIKTILNSFVLSDECEVTTEVNPETVDAKYFAEIKSVGVNRISVGIQSFDDKILESIGRIHTAKTAVEALKSAFKAGFTNVSCDFIYGLPNQTLEDFVNDLKIAVDLGVQHISLYGLKIEEGCYFYNNRPTNTADDDLQADMYLAAVKTLADAGFEHYEVSNFSKPNFYSRHNMNYWDCGEYYGFGAAAHGYVSGIRYSNYSGLDEYTKKYIEKQEQHKLTLQEALEEAIFLGFRRGCGIDAAEINKKFGIDFEKKYSLILEKYINSGHIKKTDNRYKLSEEGFLVSNAIMVEFM